jgi:hypothetical protein
MPARKREINYANLADLLFLRLLKGQSHKKVGEIRLWDVSVGSN